MEPKTDHSGHLANGVQAHSAGATYPWRVLTLGNTCVAFNGETGELGQRYTFTHHGMKGFKSYGLAFGMAEADCADFVHLDRVAPKAA